MKYVFLLSGAAGFAIVAVSGYSAERPIDLVLRDASLACLGTALVGRWFWRVLDRAFAESLAARRAIEQAASDAAKDAAPAPAPVSARAASAAAPALTKSVPSPRPATPAGASSSR